MVLGRYSDNLCIEMIIEYKRTDIGLDVTESLPVGTRLADGLFQGLAARASGLGIVGISSLAPSMQ